MTQALNSRAEAPAEPTRGVAVRRDAQVPAGEGLDDVLHPSTFAPGGSLAETDPSHIQVTIDFAEGGGVADAGYAAGLNSAQLEDTDAGQPGMVTRAEAEDALLTSGLTSGDDRMLRDSLESIGQAALDAAAEVDPAGLGLAEYEEEAIARTEEWLVVQARDRATVGGRFAESSVSAPAAGQPRNSGAASGEPFNAEDVFRELAECASVRETLQGLDNPAAVPATGSQSRVSVKHPPMLRLGEDDIPEDVRRAEAAAEAPVPALVEPAPPAPPASEFADDEGVQMLDDDDEHDIALLDETDDPEAEVDSACAGAEPQVSFAEPIDWSALETGPEDEAYDLTAGHTAAAMVGESNDDPFADAPPAMTPEQDFAELGFHHNFVIGDFSTDQNSGSDAIELDLSGLNFDDDADD